MNRKTLAALSVLALLVGGCGAGVTTAPTAASPAATGAGQVTLTYQNWTANENEMPWETELIKKFEDAHPNIKINLVLTPVAQFWDAIPTETAAGKAPDVYEIIPEYVLTYAKKNVIRAVDEYVTREGGASFSGQYFGAAWGMVNQGGHVYGLPWRFGPSAMFINKDLFDAAGISVPTSWTWDEFLHIAQRLTDASKGVYGFAYSGSKDSFGTSWEWLGHLFASGGQLLDQSGNPAIASPTAVQSFTWWTDLLTKYHVVPPETPTLDEGSITDLLGTGKVAMWNNGPWFIGSFAKYSSAHIVTAPMPRGVTDGSSAGGTLLAVSPQTKHSDEAWEFIKFMTSQSILREWSTRGSFMPTRSDVLQDPFFHTGMMTAFTEQALQPHTLVLGTLPDSGELLPALHEQMQAAYLGTVTPQQALQSAAAKWAEFLKRFRA